MTKKNQFWKGMLIGALAGGAISLFDKPTRETMKGHVKNVSGKVGYVIKHPGEMVEKVKETAATIISTVEQVGEDFSFVAEKVDELRDLTPKVTDAIKEAKDTFTHDDEEELFAEKQSL
ncbi:YtxH domain-containing protein [Neobacillus sp. LXY-1]|uniref:YtxH domain-containing protein n=1 Tax=Neobacillus sp. LXY-1 TaxID=3379133 RepID=UPI003EDE7ECD